MITGIITLDIDDQIVLLPNEHMVDPSLSHLNLLNDLVHGGVLVYSHYADSMLKVIYSDLIEQLESKCVIYIGEFLSDIIEKHPYQTITVLGSDMVKDNFHLFDTIIVFKYRSKAVKSKPCPVIITQNLKKKNPLLYFDMFTYNKEG